MNGCTQQRLCRNRRRAAGAGPAGLVRRNVPRLRDVHDVRARAEAQPAIQDRHLRRALREANQSVLQCQKTNRACRYQRPIQGWIQLRIPSAVRRVVRRAGQTRSNPDVTFRETHLCREGAHRRERFDTEGHSDRTAVLNNLGAGSDQVMHSYLLLLLHLHLHLPKNPCFLSPNALIHRLLKQAAIFIFGKQVSPWEGSGESQIYLSSDFYRRGCPLLQSSSGGPAFQNMSAVT